MTEFDIAALMQQAQQLQSQVQAMHEQLAEQSVEGSAAGGMVKVTMTGAQRVLKVEIDDLALKEDREMLQDLIVAATNAALDKSKALAGNQLGSMLPPGVLPPGLGKLFGG